MRYYLIVFITFALSIDLQSQANIFNDYHGLPDPTAPTFLRQEEIMIFDTCFAGYYIQYQTDTIPADICVQRFKNINLYSDSSKTEVIWTEKGPKINGKRFGKWIIEYGNKSWNDYYFSDYKIIKGDITEQISIDLKNKSAICNFIYYNYRKSIGKKMKIEFSISVNDTVAAKCLNNDGNEIFKVDSKYLVEEIKLLFTGYYDREIFKQ